MYVLAYLMSAFSFFAACACVRVCACGLCHVSILTFVSYFLSFFLQPFTPDLATPISKFAETLEKQKWPRPLTVGLIGSCTNSSYENLTYAAHHT